MKNTQGFTLIELLIVIAIIGILAAVMVPQLMGARTSAQKKAVQAHSANVYKAALAALADNPQATVASIVGAVSSGDCMPAVASLNNTAYGWKAGPAGSTCVIAAGALNDFSVTVSNSAISAVSVNGN